MKAQQPSYLNPPQERHSKKESSIFKSTERELIDTIGGGDQNFNLRLVFEVIFKKLHPLFSIDCGALTLYDNELSKIVNAYVSAASTSGGITCTEAISDPISLSMITTEIAGFQFPVLKSRESWLEEFGENHCPHTLEEDYLFHCYIPLEIDNEILGTLELHNHKKELSAEGLTFCCNIADLLAELVSIINMQPDNSMPDIHQPIAHHPDAADRIMITAKEYEDILRQQKDKEILLALSVELSTVKSTEEIYSIISKHLAQVYKFDYLEVLLNEPDQLFSLRSAFKETKSQIKTSAPYLVPQIVANEFLIGLQSDFTPRILTISQMEDLGWASAYITLLKSSAIHTVIVSPLCTGNEFMGILLIGLDTETIFNPSERLLIAGISSQISATLGNVIAYERMNKQLLEINTYKQQLEEEKLYLQEEIGISNNYDDIIGEGKEIQQVFSLLTNVSDSETTVLILGETGTGKELIARAIHNDSGRKDKLMVKVNCAAIPPNLIESELFGHEKGAFTGATERRIGKFELANKSTLFLDEIGELSLDLQVKLLRVLQEKEIERVGGKSTISTDVRIVSATNRNLLEEVEAGRFRRDLFYRLNVFPISLPPLRNRKEDIPLLATHFLSRFIRKSGKKIEGFSQKALSDMMKYHWPGNVRELEHLIERQVLLTKGPLIKELEIPSDQKALVIDGGEFVPVKTISENERDHIFAVLKMCNGKISGKDGAAKMLGVPATTLNSKIKRLGLAKKHIF